jgi:hypothetical protein
VNQYLFVILHTFLIFFIDYMLNVFLTGYYLKTIKFSVGHAIIFYVSIDHQGESHSVSVPAYPKRFVTAKLKQDPGYPRLKDRLIISSNLRRFDF